MLYGRFWSGPVGSESNIILEERGGLCRPCSHPLGSCPGLSPPRRCFPSARRVSVFAAADHYSASKNRKRQMILPHGDETEYKALKWWTADPQTAERCFQHCWKYGYFFYFYFRKIKSPHAVHVHIWIWNFRLTNVSSCCVEVATVLLLFVQSQLSSRDHLWAKSHGRWRS